jgi:hypothetical protein
MAVVAKRVRRPLEKLLESNAKDLTKLYQMFAERLDERVKGFERAVDSGEPLTYSLNYYRSLRDSFKREYAILKGDIQQYKNSNYEDIYKAGQQDAIQDLFEAKKIEAVIQPSFGAFHRRSLEILANELYTNKNLDATVGRRYDDIFRRIGLEAASGVVSGEDTWRQAMRKEIDALNKYGLDSFTDKSGRKWGLRAYAEMVSRTVPMHVMNTGKLNEFLEYGEDLIIISEFEPTCPLCAPWGGQILSISGATKGYPSYAEAEDAGLFHPSCRHSFALAPFGTGAATAESGEAQNGSGAGEGDTEDSRVPLLVKENSIIPEKKISQYILDKNHPKGGPKAINFEKVLGYNLSNADDLKTALLEGLGQAQKRFIMRNNQGEDLFEAIMQITGPLVKRRE